MNSPYCGKFRVTQTQHTNHDGLDLVGLDSKEIHATVSGVVHFAGWQNPADPSEGFGQFVCIECEGLFYYYGHLSEIKVKTGDNVKITDVIGIEGSTGKSTGSHCHYCARPEFKAGESMNISLISGIPNACGDYDDGYRPGIKEKHKIEIYIDGQRKYSGLLDD